MFYGVLGLQRSYIYFFVQDCMKVVRALLIACLEVNGLGHGACAV